VRCIVVQIGNQVCEEMQLRKSRSAAKKMVQTYVLITQTDGPDQFNPEGETA